MKMTMAGVMTIEAIVECRMASAAKTLPKERAD